MIESFVNIWANWLRNDKKCRPVVPVTFVSLWNQKKDRTIFCFDAVKDYMYTVLNIYSMLWCTIAHNAVTPKMCPLLLLEANKLAVLLVILKPFQCILPLSELTRVAQLANTVHSYVHSLTCLHKVRTCICFA